MRSDPTALAHRRIGLSNKAARSRDVRHLACDMPSAGATRRTSQIRQTARSRPKTVNCFAPHVHQISLSRPGDASACFVPHTHSRNEPSPSSPFGPQARHTNGTDINIASILALNAVQQGERSRTTWAASRRQVGDTRFARAALHRRFGSVARWVDFPGSGRLAAPGPRVVALD